MGNLPIFYRFQWIEQHDDVQREIVAHGDEHGEFDDHDNGERPFPTELVSEEEAEHGGDHVSRGIENTVSGVSERCRRRAIAIDDDRRILQDFPSDFDDGGDEQSPFDREFLAKNQKKPKEQNAVQNVRKRVRIAEILRCAASPCIPRPQMQSAVAPVDASHAFENDDVGEHQSKGQNDRSLLCEGRHAYGGKYTKPFQASFTF